MTEGQWKAFDSFRNELRAKCTEWMEFSKELIPLQLQSAQKDTPEYPVETPVVYNKALDELTPQSEIKLIVIGDNPGKDEQLLKNNRYLVGQAGKIAEGYFKRNAELNVDFRQNVIILNKTPLHTAKTAHLKFLHKNGSLAIKELILQSQNWMAEKTAGLHKELVHNAKNDGTDFIPELWLVGYSELKNKGIFIPYRDKLLKSYAGEAAWEKVFVYQHFSMNRFSIDLASFSENASSLKLKEQIAELGQIHRKEIFGM